MRKKVFTRRLLSVLLVLIMAISVIPTTAFAIDGSVSQDRTINRVTFPGLKFWESFNNGQQGWYTVPFDEASGHVMFCVDPGKGGSEDPNLYTMSIANGDAIDNLLTLARKGSRLGNASNTSLYNKTGKNDIEWDDILGSEVLETLDTSTLETIIQLMTVLHMHADLGDGKYGPGQYGLRYNAYAIFAVQNYIWHVCNPSSKGMWWKIETSLDEPQTNLIKQYYYAMVHEVYDLYYSGAGHWTVSDGGGSYRTKADQATASNGAVNLGGTSPKTYTVTKGLENYQKIKYITIDGGSVQNFGSGATASSGSFSITNDGTGYTVDCPADEDHTVQFLTTPTIPSASSGASTESWAIYAQASNNKQSFFTAYQAPNTSSVWQGFKNSMADITFPVFPALTFYQHKYDSVGGYDADTCTPVGDTKLDATFTLEWSTDMGASGSESSTADLYGHGASETIKPWGEDTMPASTVVNESIETSTITVGEGDDAEEVEFESDIYWDGTCTVRVYESEAPEGHYGDSTVYTHTIVYHAETHRTDPEAEWDPVQYHITVDGNDTGLTDGEAVTATWDDPLDAPVPEDDFIDVPWVGILQIIKEKQSDDIFSEEHGQGTVAGGVVSGKEYSTNSNWTIRIVDKAVYTTMTAKEAAEAFEGYEDCPYIKVVEDTANPMNALMHCYRVMLNGTGTPADNANPLTPSQFGQIFVSNIPYGTYLVTEISADADRYVKEAMYFTISEDGQVISTDIVNTSKQNVVKVVKVDAETGKTVPSASTAFRIRYMGSPEYANPEDTPNYGKYLPNATNINASVTSADDYIFYTDTAGEVTIPYELTYGIYQLEEILVPEGYYVGTYTVNGQAETAPGHTDYYGEDDDNHQTNGPDMGFSHRVRAIYDANGNHVEYYKDENIIFNYYTFEVTKQNDHVDGEEYQTYYLTVEMANAPAKGKVEISKLGERLVGFKQKTDAYGNVVSEPIYESFPLANTVFGIYAAEDVLLKDGEEPPIAYDRMTNEEVKLVTDVLNHIQFPHAEIIRSGKHETGAEVVYTLQRDKSENNISTVEYLTPLQKGTTYTLTASRYDDENGLTYDYDIEFGMEYTAGGWNYTDIHVKRTITSDDYAASIPDELPKLYNGDTEVSYEDSTAFVNKNKIDTNMELVNAYNFDLHHYEVQIYHKEAAHYDFTIDDPDDMTNIAGSVPEIPEGYVLTEYSATRITIENEEDSTDVQVAVKNADDEFDGFEPLATANPADYFVPTLTIPSGYEVKEVSFNRITLVKEHDVNDILVATADADGDFKSWEDMDTTDSSEYFTPRYIPSAIDSIPTLDSGVSVLYATTRYIYVLKDGEVKVIREDDEGNIIYTNEDGSDITDNTPDNVPDGYTYTPASGPIIAEKFDDDNNVEGYKVYVKDLDTDTYRWIDCDDTATGYKQRVQEFDITLTQHNKSTDGWKFEMDGVVLTNKATDEDTATAVITNPFDAVPVIKDYVGSETTTVDLEPVGNETTVIIKHPNAPVYFKMIDGTEVEMVHLGGFTKTIITVPCDNEFPDVYYMGTLIDAFDMENDGLTPDHNFNEVVFGDNDYIRVKRMEADTTHDKTYFVLEIVSSATDEVDAFVVDYHGSYESVSIVVPDAATGTLRGNLQLRSIYKTMRYPLSDLVETITTNDKGIATSSLLPLGDYILRELSAPEGFVATTGGYPFSLEYRDQFTPLVWASAEADNGAVNIQLDITKGFQKALNSTDYEAKAGAVFGVYTYDTVAAAFSPTDSNAIDSISAPTGTLVATVTTDEDGKSVETIKLPRGDYYVQEISTLEGYDLNDTKFIFRADDAISNNTLTFNYEDAGIVGKIRHTGYKTAEIEINTYTQIPALTMKVNGIKYDTTEELAEDTLGSDVLVKNVVDDDRSVFTITGAVGAPVRVEFDNGAKLVLNVGESTYDVTFINGSAPAPTIDTGAGSAITESTNDDGDKVCEYNPLVAFTGYTAETTMIYVAPQTKLTSANGTTLEFSYNLAAGLKEAVVTYPSSYKYYSNEDLPTKNVQYLRGDVNMDGTIDAADAALIQSVIDSLGTFTENQKLIADYNKDGSLTQADVDKLNEDITAGKTFTEKVTAKEQYLPDNAILFETEGFGNNAYVGTVVDPAARTLTFDLSKFSSAKTVTIGDAVVTLNGNTISLTGGTVKATNNHTGKSVSDGYQPDGILLNGSSMTSENTKTIALSSLNNTAEVQLDVHYDHEYMDLHVTTGTLSTAWINGTPVGVGTVDGTRLAGGNTALLVFSDNSVYRIELNNNGTVTMSVENIINGSIAYSSAANPTLRVNGSADNFLNATYTVIQQTVPMDETSIDEIRQYNIKNVTLARNDSFVKQLQVKINATSNLKDTTGVGGTGKGEDITQPIHNDLRPYISKVDATTGKELPGAKIEIYDRDGNVVASGTSDKNGKFYFEKPEPGEYVFKEVVAPAGYELNTEIFTFIVHGDGTITGDDTVKDYKKPTHPGGGGGGETPKYTISKIDATTAKGIPGAKIEVLSEDKTTVIASGYSDANGKFSFNRPKAGKYWFHEVVAPNNYVLNEEWFTFTVNTNGTVTGDNTITNEKAIISKVDATDAHGVPGAKIEVYKDDKTTVIASGYSDENGKFKFDRPEPGRYWFHEVVAPNGYLLNEEFFSFVVNEDGSIIGDCTIKDERDTVIISKIDVTTAEGVPGAKIEVMDENGNIIASGFSDENGFFGFQRPKPGKYFFHEVVAPDGFILNEELFSFIIAEDYSIIGDCTITNVPNTVIIQKVDISTGAPIQGATIEIYDTDGKLLMVGITDKNGQVYFAAPKLGQYIYRESIAPEGYILDQGTHIIEIHPDGSITGTKFSNTPLIPQTGVTDWTPILIAIMALLAMGLAAVVVIDIRRRKRFTDSK